MVTLVDCRLYAAITMKQNAVGTSSVSTEWCEVHKPQFSSDDIVVHVNLAGERFYENYIFFSFFMVFTVKNS